MMRWEALQMQTPSSLENSSTRGTLGMLWLIHREGKSLCPVVRSSHQIEHHRSPFPGCLGHQSKSCSPQPFQEDACPFFLPSFPDAGACGHHWCLGSPHASSEGVLPL